MWIEIFVHYIKRVSSIVRFKLMHPLYFHHFTFFGSLIYPPLDDLQGRRGIYLLLAKNDSPAGELMITTEAPAFTSSVGSMFSIPQKSPMIMSE